MKAIVLAGQRDGEDELTKLTGTSCKAFIEIGGKPMLFRVLETLQASKSVSAIYLSGPDQQHLDSYTQAIGGDGNRPANVLQQPNITWSAPGNSPSTSTYGILKDLAEDEQILLTTADHPLLTVEMVDTFCQQSLLKDADVVVAFAPYSLVQQEFPEMKKTIQRFKDGQFCGCNLFAFTSRRGRMAADFWRQLESDRKNPLKIIKFLGWWTLLKYSIGLLSLEDAVQTLGDKMDLKIGTVILPFGHAAVDVDSVSDYEIVQSRFGQTLPG